MTESFLHYIWQSQYFNKVDLFTTDGERLEIVKPGFQNTDAGPDFSHAKVNIGELAWSGHVEIHVQSSQWLQHQHTKDAAYDNVVLHVVYEHDTAVCRTDGTPIPTLELKGRIDTALTLNYQQLMTQSSPIPCSSSFHRVADIVRLSMLDRAVVERLQMKAESVLTQLKKNNNDWEETCYQLLAKNFGFKVNSEPFLQLAEALPYKVILKHSSQPLQVQALLFGMAGFLEAGVNDEYFQTLRREFDLLTAKYQLDKKKVAPARWKFLRLRPANFPTLRLAQLATLLTQTRGIFSRIVESEQPAALRSLFEIELHPYWQHHYRFGRKSNSNISSLGTASIDNIIINTVAPLLAAYALHKDDVSYLDRAQALLNATEAEDNKIMRLWNDLQWTAKSAFDTQALLQLHNMYCVRRQCLNCAIGAAILKPATA